MRHFVIQIVSQVIVLVMVTATETPLSAQAADAPVSKTDNSKKDDPLFNRQRKELENPIDADDNPLERAIAAMRDVQKRIGKNETGLRTRKMQQRIVDDLEKLIALARRQPPAGGDPNQKPPASQQDPKKLPSPQPKPSDSDSSGRRRKKPRDSDSRIDKGKSQKARLARHRLLTKEIWGHLPGKLRQRLRNVESDKYVQKYNDVIMRYYEALAEQSRSGNRASGVRGRK